MRRHIQLGISILLCGVVFIKYMSMDCGLPRDVDHIATPRLGEKLLNSIPFTSYTNFQPDLSLVNCELIFAGDKRETNRIRDLSDAVTNPYRIEDGYYKKRCENCTAFKLERGYLSAPVSEEEKNFPIAFSIIMYRSVEQFERLLRAVYRPHNYYCIHVDVKSSSTVRTAVRAIANCFQNVFLLSEAFDVKWGRISVLQPDLACMKRLLEYPSWKYFINLAGEDFPLKTNSEIVQILRAYSGGNDVEGRENGQDER